MTEEYSPKVNIAKELAEISKDYTQPRELIRETISNSLDASASQIWIEALEDDSSGERELLIKITDDGVGMNREELQNFFDLGYSSKRHRRKTENKEKMDYENFIGEKGHGTKITYNSSKVDVYSKFIDSPQEIWRATMDGPKRQLAMAIKNVELKPVIYFDKVTVTPEPLFNKYTQGTHIQLRGYDNNNYKTFAHGPLKDYIRWFTAWGRINIAWGAKLSANCQLYLKGLGQDEFEEIPYGHSFPAIDNDFEKLRSKDPRRPENFYVNRWVSEDIIVKDHPTHKIRIVFSVEGDSAKREDNEMLKRIGKKSATSPFKWDDYRYNVGDRYGVYFCKDFIPIERKSEVFTQTSEWTKWHAFVNCQSFNLTANRASTENTQEPLLQAIKDTAYDYVEKYVFDNDEYAEFKTKMKIEEGRRKAGKEKKEVKRRLDLYKRKTKYKISDGGRELIFLEPRSEQGVLWLIAQISYIWPNKIPWIRNVLDLDQHFGYDLLVHKKHQLTDDDEPAFVELKHELRDSDDFNHSFSYLSSIICWETYIQIDNELFDIAQQKRIFKIVDRSKEVPYTKAFLQDPNGGVGIEVVVLKKYLEEMLSMSKVT